MRQPRVVSSNSKRPYLVFRRARYRRPNSPRRWGPIGTILVPTLGMAGLPKALPSDHSAAFLCRLAKLMSVRFWIWDPLSPLVAGRVLIGACWLVRRVAFLITWKRDRMNGGGFVLMTGGNRREAKNGSCPMTA